MACITKYIPRFILILGLIVSLASCETLRPVPSNTVLNADTIKPILHDEPLSQESAFISNSVSDYKNLANATEARPRDFIGVVLGSGCTSTIIGSNTLLTAAHCVDTGATPAKSKDVLITLDRDRYPLKFKCKIHSLYMRASYRGSEPRTSQDIALCNLTNPKDMPQTGLNFFEVVATREDINVGDSILMTGFGCYNVKVEETYDQISKKLMFRAYTYGSQSKKLRIGDNYIARVHDSKSTRLNDRAKLDVHSLTGSDSPKICSGDSGGPVFRGATVSNPTAKRRVIAINSAVGNYLSETKTVTIVSRMTSLNEASVHDFFNEYLDEFQGAEICGLNVRPGSKGCRE